MTTIVHPLKLQMKRPAVADLQHALATLGFTVAADEVAAGRYGASTRQAVLAYQTRHGLPPRGEVDARTARHLNRALKPGLAKDVSAAYTVRGQAVFADGKPAAGATVRAFDQDVARATLLGETVTDDSGHYAVTFAESLFRRSPAERGGPDLFVLVLAADGSLMGRSTVHRNAAADCTIDLQVGSGKFRVYGRIVQADGSAGAGLTVAAVDRDLRTEQPLGSATTDDRGRYEILYTKDQFTRADKAGADLVVRVFDPSAGSPTGGASLRVESALIFNASVELELDLVVPETGAGLSEFERLVATLAPLLEGQGVPLAALAEADLDFLAGETGIERQHLAWLSLAHARSHETACPPLDGHGRFIPKQRVPLLGPEVLYAWFRQGLPTGLSALLDQTTEALRKALLTAIDRRIAPARLADSVEGVVGEQVATLQAHRDLQAAGANGRASIGELLATLPERGGPIDRDRLVFARLHRAFGPSAELWAQAEAAGLGDRLADLRRTLELDEITGAHLPLIAALQARAEADAAPASAMYLATLTDEEWVDLAYEHGAPPATGLTPADYARQLERAVEARYTMAVLRERLRAGTVRIDGLPSEPAVQLLSAHPDFDIRAENVDHFLGRIGAGTSELGAGLRKLARVLPVAGDIGAAALLLNQGFDSAHAIAHASLPALAERFEGQLSEETLRAIRSTAQGVAATHLALASRLSPRFNPQSTPMLPFAKASQSFLAQYPNLRTLFGDLDHCECTHCSSVLGPAAYLVDLLNFINGWDAGRIGGAMWRLRARRPDLWDLDLSCANTDTEIPYVDLVLEVLENAVALPRLLTIGAHGGAAVASEFMQGRVPPAVRDTLAQTAITLGEALTVTACLPGPGQEALPIQYWRIEDGARCWQVIYVPGLFWADYGVVGQWLGKGRSVEGALDDAAWNALHDAFTSGTLPADMVGAVPTSLGLPLKGTPTVSPVAVPTEAMALLGLQLEVMAYELRFALEAGVEIDPMAGIVRFLAADGSAIRQVPAKGRLSASLLQAIRAWLDDPSLVDPVVVAMLRLPPLTYTRTQDTSTGRWTLGTVFVWTYALVRESLVVMSLSYRSSSIRSHLAATPENRNPQAYETLRASAFPWTLPLDLPTEEVRAFLGELGVPRLALMQVLRPADRASGAYVGESLGLTNFDRDLIAPPTGAGAVHLDAWALWGLKQKGNSVVDIGAGQSRTGDWPVVLEPVSLLLQQAGLQHRELLDLLATGFGGATPPHIELTDLEDACRPSKMLLKGLGEAQLDWIHRCTRLWRRLGGGVRELDRCLSALGGPIDANALLGLSLIRRLQERLAQPTLAVVALLGHLETTAWVNHTLDGTPLLPSLYDTSFQPHALHRSDSFRFFSMASEAPELAYLVAQGAGASPLPMSAHAPFIAAALGLSTSGVGALIAAGASVGLADELTLARLAAVHGLATLCRSLHIDASALLRWQAVLGVAPFAQSAPIERAKSLLMFIERFDSATAAGLSLDAWGYLLRHELQGPFADIEDRLRADLDTVRSALRTGQALGNPSVDNLVAQLRRCGVPEPVLTAIGSETGLQRTWWAQLELPAPLVPAPHLPDELAGRVSYVEATQDGTALLVCRGELSNGDLGALALAVDATLVQQLAQRHALVHDLLVSPLRYRAATTFVASVALSEAVPLPEDLASFLSYTSGPCLALAGTIDSHQAAVAMSAIRCRHPALSAPLLKALEDSLNELAAQCTAFVQGTPAGLLGPATASALLGAHTQADVEAALLQLVPRVDADLLASTLASMVPLNQRLVAALLANAMVRVADGSLQGMLDVLSSVAAPEPGAATAADALRALVQLDKTARLVGGAALSAAELDVLQRPVFETLRFEALPTTGAAPPAPFEAWQALQALLSFRAAVAAGPATLLRLVDRLGFGRPALPGHWPRPGTEVDSLGAHLADPALQPHDLGPWPPHLPDGLDLFAEVYQMPRAQIAAACGADLLAMPWRDGFRQPLRLLALVQVLQLAQRLGTEVQTLVALVTTAPDETAAALARQLFMAQFDASALPDRLQQISDRLRRRQRDALVSHLAARDHLAGGDELLDRYLIDVQMEPCMRTSRLKQAISSVQLFVQRCLLNVERGSVDASKIDAKQWEWMKNYRVWEANRKVFLYPENWIEPELRDDKSQVFRQLEADLTQENLTLASSLDAFRGYLEQASRIAHLQVVATCEQVGPARAEVDIVAREAASPKRHFVRRLSMDLPLVDTAGIDWTPWEAIDGEVAGEHVAAFRLIGMLHLACLKVEVAESGRDWKLKLEVRRRERQGWVASKEDSTPLLWPMPPDLDVSRAFLLKALPPTGDSGQVTVECYAASLGDAIRDAATGDLMIKTTLEVTQRTQFLGGTVRALSKRVDSRGSTFYQVCDGQNDTLIATVYGDSTLGAYIGQKAGKNGVLSFDATAIAAQFQDLSEHRGGAAVRMWFIVVTATVHDWKQGYTQSRIFMVDTTMREGVLEHDFVFDLDDIFIVDPDRSETLQKVGTYLVGQDLSISFDRQDPKQAPVLTPPDQWYFVNSGLGSAKLGGWNERVLVMPGWDKTRLASERQFVALRDCDQDLYLLRGNLGLYHVVPGGEDWVFSGVRRFPLQDGFLPALAELPDEPWRPGAVHPPAITLHTANTFAVDTAASAQDLRISFDRSHPASLYDWEVFFHAPLMLAVQLSRAQRFAEAQRMFHTIFNPTSTEAGNEAVRYWRFEPFRVEASRNFGDSIDQALVEFAQGKRSELSDCIAAWRHNPFNPHLVARVRVRAYQWATIIKYIDNLLAWGDQLFRRDTIESINEATQLYVLAARILGPRPRSVPRPPMRAYSYGDLHGRWDEFANAWVALEDMLGPWPGAVGSGSLSQQALPVGQLYFCVPPNDEITALWDAVGDRLFKIRHCMNIDGVERQLPLFEPPIDPALLVRAVAAGVDIASALADLAAPVPLYRFNVTLQQAKELCSELKALGAGLLAALERKDAEALAQQRAAQEIGVLKLTREIRLQQIEEARRNQDGLIESRRVVEARYRYYEFLQGKGEAAAPARDEKVTLEPIALTLATTMLDASVTGLGISRTEQSQLRSMDNAHSAATAAGVLRAMAGIAFAVGAFPLAAASASAIGQGISAVAGIFSELAADDAATSQRQAIVGGYERRRSDWVFQSNMALREMQQIDRQLAAADMRIAIAQKELALMNRQIDNAGSVDEFMRSKFTNVDLHAWTSAQISSLYFQTYQLAHQLAKRAQRCFEFELGSSDSGFIQFGQWDSLRKGLLSGERLHHDLRRLETAFHERNQREYEITKQVSLAQVDPLALLALRQSGRCEFTIPEIAFDMDCPGQYLRRIKSVSLSIPCVTGPYTGVHCKLTLLSSAWRIKTGGSDYGQPMLDDDRFVFDHRGIQSVVTSGALADAGVFEMNLRDERYLPFEGAGAHSTWRLELPDEIRQFDYDTISDIVVHLRYTAREGGEPLRNNAVKACKAALAAAAATGSVRLFSIRREFPNEWAAFAAADPSKGRALVDVLPRIEHFPAWLKGAKRRKLSYEIKSAVLIARPASDAPAGEWFVYGALAADPPKKVGLSPNAALGGLLCCDLLGSALVGSEAFQEIALHLDSNKLDDLWLAIGVSGTAT